MPVLLIVNNPKHWPIRNPGVQVIGAREYLTNPGLNGKRGIKVFNMCHSYGYQSLGYYVSLLAEARDQRPRPDTTAIQDLKSQRVVKVLAEDMDEVVQASLRRLKSSTFELSVYFGQNMAGRYEDLARRLYNVFHVPMLRAVFSREGGRWTIQAVRAISMKDVPDSHRPFLLQAAETCFAKRSWAPRFASVSPFDMAILHDPQEPSPPSNAAALRKFQGAFQRAGFNTQLITKDDFGELGEFDALFIRATTRVNHYTYHFARKAAAEGLVVIDDPLSISRCTNKVFLAHRLANHRVPIPRTVIVHAANVEEVVEHLGLPCVLKQPDSAFSIGVVKVATREQFLGETRRLLERSELVVAQEFVPTEFDWRVVTLDRKILLACKYHMARAHWQIINHGAGPQGKYGSVQPVPLEQVPQVVLRTGLRAANLMGSGLYGVDLKQFGRRCVVMEVNDNPNLDCGEEDSLLKQELYDRLAAFFRRRLERQRKGPGPHGR